MASPRQADRVAGHVSCYPLMEHVLKRFELIPITVSGGQDPPDDSRAPQGDRDHVIGLNKGAKAMNEDLRIDRPGRIPKEESVRDVMTPLPRAMDASASVMDAAEIMRDSDIGDVVVLEDQRLYGILTDRDIVVRVLAEGSDPATVRVGQVCSRELTTIPPTA